MNKNIDFIVTSLKIKFTILTEYRSNLYSGILGNTIFMSVLFFTYNILQNNFQEVFYWTFEEYLLFAIFLEIFLFIFSPWFRHLSQTLLKGDLNKYLTRPLNPFLQYSFDDLSVLAILYSNLYVFLGIIYFIFIVPEFYFIKFIFILLMATFGGIFLTSMDCLINNLAFFMKKNDFIKDIKISSENLFSQYPASFFKTNKLRIFSLFIPLVYYASFVTDFYFGYINFDSFLQYFGVLLLLIGISSYLAYLLWKNGMKRYEAFG